MANDQFNPHVLVGGSAFGIGAMVGSVMAGIQNAAYEIDEIVQEHHNEVDLKAFFAEVQRINDGYQKIIDDQKKIIEVLTLSSSMFSRELAESLEREKKLRRKS
jgi:hypothetical protein